MQYAFGVCFKANDRLVLRSHFSSKFRKPTFNEKYWNPGGNPQLKPEKGNGGELTAEVMAIGQHDGSFWLEAKITGYYQSIDNWIQWVIHDSLTPVEYKKVRASGTETWIEYGIHSGSLRVKGFFNYNYNRSMIVNTYDDNASYKGKQLMYIPLHTLKTGCEAQYKNFLLGFTANYTGMRETVETGDTYLQLPAYTVMNIHAGLSKEVWKVNLACNFRVENVFNKAYEVIRAYPLPGRTYHLSLMIGWNKTSPEN
jgi:iron complex outermembrane receptor protein